MVGKIMDKSIKFIGFILAFWLLSYLTYTIIQEFIKDYNIFHTEDTPAVITEKISTNSLTSTPNYYVIVDLNESDSFNGIKNRVFGWQFKRLDVGDTINGHYIHRNHFFTTLDIITDSVFIICLLVFMLFLYIALLIWPLDAFINKINKGKKPGKPNKHQYRQKKKPPRSKKKKSKRKKKKKIEEQQTLLNRILPKKWYQYIRDITFSEIFLLTCLIIALLLTGRFAINGVHKFMPFGKTQTEALVVDKVSESETYYYIGKVSDPYFSLTLKFADENGEIYTVIKEVTKSVYKKHDVHDWITINYSTHQPYNIFVPDYSLFNLIETFGYAKFNFYMVIFTALCLFISVRIYKRLRK